MPVSDFSTHETTDPVAESSSHVGAATLAAVGAFVFLILRVFAVSDYHWDTAFAVSTTLGLGDGLALVFGSLMAGDLLTSWLLIAIVPLLIAAQVWGSRRRRSILLILTAISLTFMLALTVSFNRWWLPATAAAVVAIIAGLRRLPWHDRARRGVTRVMSRAGAIAGGAVLVTAAFANTPWVPREHIETTDGMVTGYVLSVDSGYLNVLTDDHEFVIILSQDVRSRR